MPRDTKKAVFFFSYKREIRFDFDGFGGMAGEWVYVLNLRLSRSNAALFGGRRCDYVRCLMAKRSRE